MPRLNDPPWLSHTIQFVSAATARSTTTPPPPSVAEFPEIVQRIRVGGRVAFGVWLYTPSRVRGSGRSHSGPLRSPSVRRRRPPLSILEHHHAPAAVRSGLLGHANRRLVGAALSAHGDGLPTKRDRLRDDVLAWMHQYRVARLSRVDRGLDLDEVTVTVEVDRDRSRCDRPSPTRDTSSATRRSR